MFYKTVEAKLGREKEVQTYLNQIKVKNSHYTLSDGTNLWAIETENTSVINNIEKLDSVLRVKDTVFYYPS